MARIRSVKPQLRTDLTVAEWPRDARYAFVLLWGYLDDHGRGLDDLRLLVADLFPLDRDVTERKLDGWIKRMATPSEHGEAPICRYTIAGRRYLHAVKWRDHQRVSHPQDSRFPPCPEHEHLPSGSGTIPESLPNENGTPPEPFRPSRTPAEQGEGSREVEQGAGSRDSASRSGQPPATPPRPELALVHPDPGDPDDTRHPVAQIVAAYVDGATNAGQPRPAETLRKRVGRQAGQLLAEHHPLAQLLTAAQHAGAGGWTDLAVQLQRDAATRHPAGNARPSASAQAAQAALDAGARVAARHAAQEHA